MMTAIIDALRNCLDSLQYVNKAHPEATGGAVRAGRIAAAEKALRNLESLPAHVRVEFLDPDGVVGEQFMESLPLSHEVAGRIVQFIENMVSDDETPLACSVRVTPLLCSVCKTPINGPVRILGVEYLRCGNCAEQLYQRMSEDGP